MTLDGTTQTASGVPSPADANQFNQSLFSQTNLDLTIPHQIALTNQYSSSVPAYVDLDYVIITAGDGDKRYACGRFATPEDRTTDRTCIVRSVRMSPGTTTWRSTPLAGMTRRTGSRADTTTTPCSTSAVHRPLSILLTVRCIQSHEHRECVRDSDLQWQCHCGVRRHLNQPRVLLRRARRRNAHQAEWHHPGRPVDSVPKSPSKFYLSPAQC